MGKVRKRFDKGIELIPEDLTAEDLTREGELAIDEDQVNDPKERINKLKVKLDGETESVVTESQTQELKNKTIKKSDGNIIETDASDINYNNQNSGLSATDAQSAIDELEDRLEDVENQADDLVTLSGVDKNDEDLGQFSGNIITDDSTIKEALQELETQIDVNTSDILDLSDEIETDELTVNVETTLKNETTIKDSLKIEADTQVTGDIVFEGSISEKIIDVDTGNNVSAILQEESESVYRLISSDLERVKGIIREDDSKAVTITLLNETGNDIFLEHGEDVSGTQYALAFSFSKGKDIKLQQGSSITLFNDTEEVIPVFKVKGEFDKFVTVNGIDHSHYDSWYTLDYLHENSSSLTLTLSNPVTGTSKYDIQYVMSENSISVSYVGADYDINFKLDNNELQCYLHDDTSVSTTYELKYLK